MVSLTRLRKTIWLLVSETIAEWKQDKASNLAAALAYYTIFSLAPLLIIVIAIAGFFFGEAAVQGEVVGQLQGLVGKEGASIIQTTLENVQKNGTGSGFTASLISLGILFLGATGMFVQLQNALNAIWNVKPKPNQGLMALVRTRILSFSMVVGIGFLLLVSLVISAILSAIGHVATGLLPGMDVLWSLLNLAVSFGITTLLFAMIFKFLPDVQIAWGDVWMGAGLTTLLFVAGKSLLGLYLGQSSFSSTYGAAGSLVIIVAWVYYSAQILFLGAEFTQVYARHFGSRIRPNQRASLKNPSPSQSAARGAGQDRP
ncbi:YihY/virulence factor BrkB family protein [Lyngbya confervoides]|uniref:YihY/virulence factor BrkB family protein n=1 Tax=Lyngbya confervoides BDU141951 TaxID=1574623 RepID=A0ABD4SZ42_9CYAN|nr:YihY/virulence factor BrkB family protein [Lyngbya confervoides]MCM1981691.1 YihY/virulence factor BrkB family protein [Lyngbya confervoides BDU141951]